MGQEDEDSSRLGDNEDNRSTNDSTQRLIESLAKHKSKSNSRNSRKHSGKRRSSKNGPDGDDSSRIGESLDNRSRTEITRRLQNTSAKHRSKSDSRISKNHSRKSSSRKSSKHKKTREFGKSASRKPGFSTPNFTRITPATKSRKSHSRSPSPETSEKTRNSESDSSHGSDSGGRRSRKRKHDDSTSSSEDSSDESSADGAMETLEGIKKKIFTPTKNRGVLQNAGLVMESTRVKKPRLLRMEADNVTAQQVFLSKSNFIKAGPPILRDGASLKEFQSWKKGVEFFVERLPGYKPEIMARKPDFKNMPKHEQIYTFEVFTNVYGWLVKAGAQNMRVERKTRAIKTKPYPDIVGWWKAVNSIYALTQTEMELRIEQLNHFYQLPGEKCKAYYDRFDDSANEIKLLGTILDDIYLGGRCFRGLLQEHKKQADLIFSSNLIVCSLDNMAAICKHIDELSVHANPNQVDSAPIRANLSYSVNSSPTAAVPKETTSYYGPSKSSEKNADYNRGSSSYNDSYKKPTPSYNNPTYNSKNYDSRPTPSYSPRNSNSSYYMIVHSA